MASSALRTSASSAAELVTAAAFQEPHVDLNPAFGTLLAPLALLRRLDFDFFLLGGPILHIAGLVGPLQRALRMDAVTRIGSFPADGTEVFDDLRNDGDRLEDAHKGSES